MKLTAYHYYLWNKTEGNRDLIALLLCKDVEDQNLQAFNLLSQTGDEIFKMETFYKAADLLVEKFKQKISDTFS